MKKILLFFTILSWPLLNVCMDYLPNVNNIITTVYDKFDPKAVLQELETKGVSPFNRVKMTQEHRVDRIIPHHITQKDTESLAKDIVTIITKKYPISELAKNIALEHLCDQRSSIEKNEILLNLVTNAIDLINPSQITKDIQSNKLYHTKILDLETRVTKNIQTLIDKKEVKELQNLIDALIQYNKDKPKDTIIPQERITLEAYRLIRENEKKIKATKKILLETFKATKNNSDNEN